MLAVPVATVVVIIYVVGNFISNAMQAHEHVPAIKVVS